MEPHTAVVARVHKRFGTGWLLDIAVGPGSCGYREPKVKARLRHARQLHQSFLIYAFVTQRCAMVHRYRTPPRYQVLLPQRTPLMYPLTSHHPLLAETPQLQRLPSLQQSLPQRTPQRTPLTHPRISRHPLRAGTRQIQYLPRFPLHHLPQLRMEPHIAVVARVHKKFGTGWLLDIAVGTESYGYRETKVTARLRRAQQLHQSFLIYVSVIQHRALVHQHRIPQ